MRNRLAFLLVAILALQVIPGAFAWDIERPDGEYAINERTENADTNGEASVGLGVAIDDYDEGGGTEEVADYVAMNISMTANSRKGITYTSSWEPLFWWVPEDELWYRSDSVNAGDDAVIPVDIPQYQAYFAFRFYGGRWSAEYQRIFVSTNGFISFDDSTMPSPSPSDIPIVAKPNAIVATVWTDLHIDSEASIITGLYAVFSRWYFVIIWNNALHKASGKRLTFQLILENAPHNYPVDRRYGQSYIWMSYKSVSPINTDFTTGIEDQEGSKGSGGLYAGSSLGAFNWQTLWFRQNSNSFFLKRLTINLRDSNAQTILNILDEKTPDRIRGYNVRLKSQPTPQPDEGYMFVRSLGGWITLLLAGKGLVIVGVVSVLFTAWQTVELLARHQYSSVEWQEFSDYSQEVYIKAPTYDNVVDATLSMAVHWVFLTPNDGASHSLTITAKLEYYEHFTVNGSLIEKPPITTSVNLSVHPDGENDNVEEATEIVPGTYVRLYLGNQDFIDYYKIHVNRFYNISITVRGTKLAPTSSALVFTLALFEPGSALPPLIWIGPGNSLSLGHIANLTGDYVIGILRHWETYGFYSLSVDVSHPDGDGGCPYVSTWNGEMYSRDNNLMPAAESLNGSDTTDYYLLQQPLVGDEGGKYSLLFNEFQREQSQFDYAQLLAIDHQSSVNVAVSNHGEVLNYANPNPPMSAIDNDKRNVKNQLTSVDGNYYEGYNGSYVTLNFGDLDVSVGAKLVLRADFPKKMSIYVQVHNKAGVWNTVDALIPRHNWATEIVDMSQYLPDERGNLKIRLYFTANHKIDFVGLDTSPQAPVDVHEGLLVSAIHSSDGDVTANLITKDQIYAELIPGQAIELTFVLPPQTQEARNYIIIVTGNYHTITP